MNESEVLREVLDAFYVDADGDVYYSYREDIDLPLTDEARAVVLAILKDEARGSDMAVANAYRSDDGNEWVLPGENIS